MAGFEVTPEGIELLNSHWEKVRHKEVFKSIPNSDARVNSMCGTVRVQLAVIPYEEFEVHSTVELGDFRKAYAKALKRRTEARARCGWKGEADTDLYSQEISAEENNVIEHKYFKVSHVAL
jgi:hypothetical protein